MKRGIIGVPRGSADRIRSIEASHNTKQEFGQELTKAVAVQEQRTLAGGLGFVEGRALKEEIDDEDYWYFDDDSESIRQSERKTDVQRVTDFIGVPANDGQDGFVLVDSSSGEFAFDLIGGQNGCLMERAEIRLGDFYRDHDSFQVMTGGQRGRLDGADTVMAWGDDVGNDADLESAIETAAESNQLPQLAGEYSSPHGVMHVNMAASGYVEVYSPDWSTYEFLEWLQDDIVPYIEQGSEEGSTTPDPEDDEAQPSIDDFDQDEGDSE